jgi:hypothetical protein
MIAVLLAVVAGVLLVYAIDCARLGRLFGATALTVFAAILVSYAGATLGFNMHIAEWRSERIDGSVTVWRRANPYVYMPIQKETQP